MKSSRNQGGWRRFFRRGKQTDVAMSRALQFLALTAIPYTCIAGDRLITVLPNGDLYPCRRMPIKAGNVLETPLSELYATSEVFQSLRDDNRLNETCRKCTFGKMCRGGLKCLSYARHNDPFKGDPGCWIASA